MARNNENTRHSNYVIRIVCEGNKTEPLFFTSLCDLYCKDKGAMDVRTIPQPYIPEVIIKAKSAKSKPGITLLRM